MPKKSIDAKQVEEFLVLNPDFLSNNSHILDSIEIVHKTGGAISLIQKQVEVLRKNYYSPTTVILDENYNKIQQQPGKVETGQFMKILKRFAISR